MSVRRIRPQGQPLAGCLCPPSEKCRQSGAVRQGVVTRPSNRPSLRRLKSFSRLAATPFPERFARKVQEVTWTDAKPLLLAEALQFLLELMPKDRLHLLVGFLNPCQPADRSYIFGQRTPTA